MHSSNNVDLLRHDDFTLAALIWRCSWYSMVLRTNVPTRSP